MDGLKEKGLNSIKSLNILKKIFYLLNKDKILELIIYNNNLKKKLNINIENYKNQSGKYKIGEKNGRGKEFALDTNVLIYEGEYLNGKKNGKGKEYNRFNGCILFEGEYLKGKRERGKQYNEDKKIVFDGEYLNGEKWKGIAKEYNYNNGQLKFEGEYITGKIWNGKGYNDKGEIEYEIKDGKGIIKQYSLKGELIFEGDYING